MSATAFWRRIEAPGHDAALLRRVADGWSLQGKAVYASPEGPAAISYAVTTDADWNAKTATVEGFLGTSEFRHTIRREPDGWYLDDVLNPGLEHLKDLDFGFTPATNLLQLRRARIERHSALDLPSVWFDIGEPALAELRQHYERLDETHYRYAAPDVPYEATLELSECGFVNDYPKLWIMEGEVAGK